MTKKSSKLEIIFCGILFCISVTALVISCLAFTKKGGGEYYSDPLSQSSMCKVPCACANWCKGRPLQPVPPGSGCPHLPEPQKCWASSKCAWNCTTPP